MDMHYQKQVHGMEITRTLSTPITHGSYEEAAIAMVLLRARSTFPTPLAVPSATTVFVQYFPQLERKRLTLLKVVMNNDE